MQFQCTKFSVPSAECPLPVEYSGHQIPGNMISNNTGWPIKLGKLILLRSRYYFNSLFTLGGIFMAGFIVAGKNNGWDK